MLLLGNCNASALNLEACRLWLELEFLRVVPDDTDFVLGKTGRGLGLDLQCEFHVRLQYRGQDTFSPPQRGRAWAVGSMKGTESPLRSFDLTDRFVVVDQAMAVVPCSDERPAQIGEA